MSDPLSLPGNATNVVLENHPSPTPSQATQANNPNWEPHGAPSENVAIPRILIDNSQSLSSPPTMVELTKFVDNVFSVCSSLRYLPRLTVTVLVQLLGVRIGVVQPETLWREIRLYTQNVGEHTPVYLALARAAVFRTLGFDTFRMLEEMLEFKFEEHPMSVTDYCDFVKKNLKVAVPTWNSPDDLFNAMAHFLVLASVSKSQVTPEVTSAVAEFRRRHANFTSSNKFDEVFEGVAKGGVKQVRPVNPPAAPVSAQSEVIAAFHARKVAEEGRVSAGSDKSLQDVVAKAVTEFMERRGGSARDDDDYDGNRGYRRGRGGYAGRGGRSFGSRNKTKKVENKSNNGSKKLR